MGFKMKDPDSMGLLNMIRNKRGMGINLKSAAGRKPVLRMLKDADILVENYRPGAMKRPGLGYEISIEINLWLDYTGISGSGQTRSCANRPSFDLMAQAMSGVTIKSRRIALEH
jgi:formyl-CoA transferase